MGLLDQFLGSGGDDPRTQAMGLLGAGLMAGNPALAFANANGSFAAAKDAALKRQLLQMQMANYQSEIEARKLAGIKDQRKQEWMNSLFPDGAGGASVSPGAFVPSVDGMGPTMPQSAAPQGQRGGLLALSQQLGIPPAALQADMAFNDGKGIAEMLFKRGTPDMQVSGNYAYDKNRLGAGYLPSLSTSQDGKTSMIQIDANGMPVVSAPSGAENTFARYRNIDESAKANFDTITVTPQGQSPQMTTRGALVRNPQVSGQTIQPGQQAQMDEGRAEILKQELVKAQSQLAAAMRAGDQSAAARAQGDIASLQRELGGKSATVGMPLQSEEEKLRAKTGVEGDAKTNEARAKDVKIAQQFLSVADQAEKILNTGPTASGMGSMVDKTAAFFGKATDGAIAAQQLKALGGWLVANVPRMEGPQSNFDVGNYQRMAADVQNDTLPIPARMAALQSIKQMMGQIINQGGMGGVTGGWEPTGKSSVMSSGGWSATLKKK